MIVSQNLNRDDIFLLKEFILRETKEGRREVRKRILIYILVIFTSLVAVWICLNIWMAALLSALWVVIEWSYSGFDLGGMIRRAMAKKASNGSGDIEYCWKKEDENFEIHNSVGQFVGMFSIGEDMVIGEVSGRKIARIPQDKEADWITLVPKEILG